MSREQRAKAHSSWLNAQNLKTVLMMSRGGLLLFALQIYFPLFLYFVS